ncbi:MAG: cobalamin B12-binding domain-containing protein [Eubacteriales bacterium]
MYLSQIATSLREGDTGEVRRLTVEALERRYPPERILNQAFIPAMEDIGKKFRGSEIFIPEVLRASRAMHGGIRILQDKFLRQVRDEKPVRVLVGTVAGDLHDIGKNLVSIFITTKGCEVINLGIDVPTEEFVWAVRKHKPQVLAMSALLTTTMPAMQETVQALEQAGLRDNLKILVGGGPVTKQFAEEIGADGYAYDAKLAADWVAEMFPF